VGGSNVRNVSSCSSLSTANSVTTADKWPVNGLGVGPCGVLNYPFGVAIFQGSYTAADISSAAPLQIYEPGEYHRLDSVHDLPPFLNRLVITLILS